MYNDDQYQRAKAQIGTAPQSAKAILRRRIQEYELTNPAHLSESTGVQKLDETAPKEAPSAPSLLASDLPQDAPAPKAPDKLQAFSDQLNAPDPNADPERNQYLPNASKLKTLDVPPEYVAKNSLNGLKHVALAAAQTARDMASPLGPVLGSLRNESPLSAGLYFEPSEEHFQKEQGPILKTLGVAPGTDEYRMKFDEWKDRKYKQAYDQAVALDQPLTRVDYVQHSGAWAKLKDFLATAPDIAQTFSRGLVNGATSHLATSVPDAIEDKLTGSSLAEQHRDQEDRNPATSIAGELTGALAPAGGLAKVADVARGGAEAVAPRLLGGTLGRALAPTLGAVAGANAAGVADLAGRSASRGLEDYGLGQTPLESAGTAKDQFMSQLLPTMGLATGFGLAGHALASGGNALSRSITRAHPEIADLAPGGASTHPIWGVTPGDEVGANLEAARPGIPGEDKAAHPPNATTLQVRKLQEPLTAENATSHKEAYERIDAEQNAAIEADPKLKELKPAPAGARAIADWGLSLLGNDTEALPMARLGTIRQLADKIWRPKLINAADASSMASRSTGKVVTLDQAKALGVDIDALKQGITHSEGVPEGAPPITDDVELREGQTNADLKPIDIAPERKLEGPPASSVEDIFGVPAEKPTPTQGRAPDLLPRTGRAFRTPYEPPLEGDPHGFEADRVVEWAKRQPDEISDPFGGWRTSVPSNAKPLDTPTNPMAAEASVVSATPSGPPPELRSPPVEAPAPSGPKARPGIPDQGYRVVLEPKSFDAKQFETILGNVDLEAKAGQARGDADPQLKNLQRAFRVDREQFGKPWTDMIAGHHQVLNSLEQRAGAAGIGEKRPYSEMQSSSRDAVDARLEGYPGKDKTREALTSLAGDADARAKRIAQVTGEAPPPGVLHELEVLAAQNAYTKLKGMAVPKFGEALGAGGLRGNIRGLGPFVSLRAEAAARGLSAGPTGEPTVSPRLKAYLDRVTPRAPRLTAFSALGGGALGMKASIGYHSASDHLDESQKQTLMKMLDSIGQPKQEAEAP